MIFALPTGTVHIWLAHSDAITDANLWRAYEAQLSEMERTRLAKIVDQTTAQEFVLGRALLRHALSHHSTNVDVNRWSFTPDHHGKLVVSAPSSSTFEISLTHSRGAVSVAVACESVVGVDIESLIRKMSYRELARTICSRRERQWLSRLEPDCRSKGFIALWTLKEAYAKAKGLGLGMDFDKIEFEITFQSPWKIIFQAPGEDPNVWSFWHFASPSDFLLAVALKQNSTIKKPTIRVREAIPFLMTSDARIAITGITGR